MNIMGELLNILRGDKAADHVVPPSGFTVQLTIFSAGAMAFLAVFALAVSLATGEMATRWSEGLARTSTVRILAPEAQEGVQVQAALRVLEATPGVASARALTLQEQRALLEPWFGPDLPVDRLPVPRLIEVVEDTRGYDGEGLRQRLAAEAPGAILDDHTRWRKPLVQASKRIRLFGMGTLVLITLSMAAIITLAAQSALSANLQVIQTLRLIGAKDTYIARAFVRRFTSRAALGAFVGALCAAVLIALLPPPNASTSAFFTDFGFRGAQWFWVLVMPLSAGLITFISTRAAALRMLRVMS